MEITDQLLLGIDIGTTGSKCSIYDLTGQPVASAYKEYAMISPQPGWCEEDPNDWWTATADNIREALHAAHLEAGRIAAIGVSCTNSIIPVDRDCRPIYHAIMQLDQRAMAEVAWLKETIGDARVFDITGNRIAPGTFSLPTLRWFMLHQPDIMERTYRFLVPSGFIIGKLTGEFTINLSRMATTLLADIYTGRWSSELAEQAGISLDKLPRPSRACEIVGEVTATAARATGLRPGTPVVGGAMDTVAAAVGAGAIRAGDSFLAVGTCARLCLTTAEAKFDNRFMNCLNAFDSAWLSIAAVNGAGVSMRWFRDVFGEVAVEQARIMGRSSYSLLDDAAMLSPCGANGLIYLPYLAGERSPIWDPYARGVFFGINLATTQGDFIRAIMEGVAFAIRQNLDIWRGSGKNINLLTLGGGIAKSAIWSQIMADILDCSIVQLTINETETLGDAILAGVGVGLIFDPVEVATGVINKEALFVPNTKYSVRYAEQFALYKKLYCDLKKDFAELAVVNRGA